MDITSHCGGENAFVLSAALAYFPIVHREPTLLAHLQEAQKYLADMWELLKRLHFSLDEEMRRATVSREMKISAHG